MANPLLLLARALLSSEAQSKAAPYMPTGVQQLLPRESLAQQLAQIPSAVGYMTGLKQEAPSGNLQTDYMVSPTGVMDTAGNQMITGQGVMGFQPRDQYEFDMPYNPATDMMGRDPDLEAFLRSLPDYSRMPTGEISTSPMTTQVPANEYESWWNPVSQPDLLDMLSSTPPEEEENQDQEEFGSLMGPATPQVTFLRQANVER
jgi:hypothetical protein